MSCSGPLPCGYYWTHVRDGEVGIVKPFFAEVGTPENQLPEDWFGSVYPLTGT